jgi:hypothetical protein
VEAGGSACGSSGLCSEARRIVPAHHHGRASAHALRAACCSVSYPVSRDFFPNVHGWLAARLRRPLKAVPCRS